MSVAQNERGCRQGCKPHARVCQGRPRRLDVLYEARSGVAARKSAAYVNAERDAARRFLPEKGSPFVGVAGQKPILCTASVRRRDARDDSHSGGVAILLQSFANTTLELHYAELPAATDLSEPPQDTKNRRR